METKNRLFSITEYCLKNKIERYRFFIELKKFPKRAARLCKNKSGEYLIDEEAMSFIGDRLRVRQDGTGMKVKKESPESALADEMNSLISENEKLKREVNRLSKANGQLVRLIDEIEIGKMQNE